jgi:hemerythrin
MMSRIEEKMSNNDIAWLAEPHTHALFMQFPLPLAIVGSDGCVKQLNHCFESTFGREYLDSSQLQAILDAPLEPDPMAFRCDTFAVEVYLRAVKVGENQILVLEKAIDNNHSAELAALNQRIHELERISASDRLTGAWNRAHFDRVIAIELGRSVRYRQPVSLIFFDIDHFKLVNDTYGHAVGDKVLCELVNVMNANIRSSDMLFRWGGEEFAILASSTSYQAAGKLAEILRSKIAEHCIEGVGQITVSLGVAEYLSGESDDHWFKRADAALYTAKNSGRNRVVTDTTGSSDVWADGRENSMILRLSWHDAYACGQPVIDEEHHQLFDLANTLMNAAFSRGEKPQEFKAALEKLLAHVVKHFADEEAILAAHHYPELALHARAHKRLVERALQLRDEALSGGVTMGELVDFLADEVVARHMLKMDRGFYPLFNNQLFNKEEK